MLAARFGNVAHLWTAILQGVTIWSLFMILDRLGVDLIGGISRLLFLGAVGGANIGQATRDTVSSAGWWFFIGYLIALIGAVLGSIAEVVALIDGASRFTIIRKIVLPLAMPGIVTTCIFALLTCWDEFLFALIFASTYNAKTLTIAISEFTTRHMIDYGLMMTGGMLASLPPIVFAMCLQKYIVRGLTEGSVKE
jgi:ABC-type glycerol-3-phosphate transport system permease component